MEYFNNQLLTIKGLVENSHEDSNFLPAGRIQWVPKMPVYRPVVRISTEVGNPGWPYSKSYNSLERLKETLESQS